MFPREADAFIIAQDASIACVSTGLYKKEVMKVGTYITGEKRFTVEKSDLDNFAAQFKAMQANGVKVNIPLGHTEQADKNRGWVKSIDVEGESCFATMEINDADPDALIKNNDVSIYAKKEWKDAKGNAYPWGILHVALTPRPLIPGLAEFEKLAATLTYLPEKVEDKTDTTELGKTRKQLYELKLTQLLEAKKITPAIVRKVTEKMLVDEILCAQGQPTGLDTLLEILAELPGAGFKTGEVTGTQLKDVLKDGGSGNGVMDAIKRIHNLKE